MMPERTMLHSHYTVDQLKKTLMNKDNTKKV